MFEFDGKVITKCHKSKNYATILIILFASKLQTVQLSDVYISNCKYFYLIAYNSLFYYEFKIKKERIVAIIIINDCNFAFDMIHFTKMHGAGNDYIYVDTLYNKVEDPEACAITWSRPHFGIGSDGLVLIERSERADADFRMRIFNADGSEAMMCGNASRCVGKYVYEKGITEKTVIRLETLSGIKIIRLDTDNLGKERHVKSASVDMGEPVFEDFALFNPQLAERLITSQWSGTFVSMGNPHFVIFVDNINEIDVTHYGSLLERHQAFPERCNIEFAQVTGKNEIRMRVWERGSGITMACGTGACATAVAAAVTAQCSRESAVHMDGGTLRIRWDKADNHVYMTGPAEFVFEGDIKYGTD